MASSILHSLLEMGYEPFYAFTLLASLWRYPKYFDTPLRFLPILYLYTFLNEVLGYLTKSDEYIAFIFNDIDDNSIIYNLYTIVSYLYYYYIFWSFSKNKEFSKKRFVWNLYLFDIVYCQFFLTKLCIRIPNISLYSRRMRLAILYHFLSTAFYFT